MDNNINMKWQVLYKPKTKNRKVKTDEIINILLKNRGLKTRRSKEEFLKPTSPSELNLKDLGIKKKQVDNAITRIRKAINKKERIIIYGDYDADGICATAVLWKTLYKKTKKVLPHIPDRFSEGYGLNPDSVKFLKKENPDLSLIITVDNGIVASKAVDTANKLGIDVVITDHHLAGKKLPKAHAIVHSIKLAGAGVAWIFAREIRKCHPELGSGSKGKNKTQILRQAQNDKTVDLELAAIGTISDQVPLIGANRSIAKYGLKKLNKTKNLGLSAIIDQARLKRGDIGTYEVGFVIAPRINAMGRLEHAIDSLRLLCTNNKVKATEYAQMLGKTNTQRQEILDKVVAHAQEKVIQKKWKGAIILSHDTYHEGVIGLAASKLVSKYYRPAVVIAKGQDYSKASARSITGFNIIESIRSLKSIIIDGGGHPMAAGFTIETEKIGLFEQEFEKISSRLLTEDILTRSLKIDLELDFNAINWHLFEKLARFGPFGVGNPEPLFASKKVEILDARCVGRDAKHLKLKLQKSGRVFDAIAFGFGDLFLKPGEVADIAYNIVRNDWRGNRSLEFKIKDIKCR